MLLAGLVFIALLVAGAALGELTWRAILGFVLVAAGALALFIGAQWSLVWYSAVLAGLDVILVLWVFKGDLTIG